MFQLFLHSMAEIEIGVIENVMEAFAKNTFN